MPQNVLVASPAFMLASEPITSAPIGPSSAPNSEPIAPAVSVTTPATPGLGSLAPPPHMTVMRESLGSWWWTLLASLVVDVQAYQRNHLENNKLDVLVAEHIQESVKGCVRIVGHAESDSNSVQRDAAGGQ